jgi:type IV pilus assembly protein PilE
MRNKRCFGVGGFTLVELMITVAVIGILAAIAFPSYTNYIQRGKIAEATSNLSDLRLRAEKSFADNRAYNTGNWDTTPTLNARYFTYSCAKAATTYTCTATGVANQGMTGFSYSIDQSNTRNSTFTGLTGWNNSSTCWVSRKGESC